MAFERKTETVDLSSRGWKPRIEWLPVARVEDVVLEQFERLYWHWINSPADPSLCAGGRGMACVECARFARVKKILLAAFETERYSVAIGGRQHVESR